VPAQDNNVAEHEKLSKENKALLLNATVGAAVLTCGLLEWDYGDRSPHLKEEKWFGKDTPEGGADKAGHMYFSYAPSHLFSYQYKRWGYDQEPAIKLGCLSSLGIQTLIEIGDSFSSYGFSYEDELFNILGVAIGYIWSDIRKYQGKSIIVLNMTLFGKEGIKVTYLRTTNGRNILLPSKWMVLILLRIRI